MKYLIMLWLFISQQTFAVSQIQSSQFELRNEVVLNESGQHELHVSLTNLSGSTLNLYSAHLPWMSYRMIKEIILNGSVKEREYPISNYSLDPIELKNNETIKGIIPVSELIFFEDIPKKINMEIFWSYELEDVYGMNYGYKSGIINYQR